MPATRPVEALCQRGAFAVLAVLAVIVCYGGMRLPALHRIRTSVARHGGHLCEPPFGLIPGNHQFDCVNLTDSKIDGESLRSLLSDLRGFSVK